MDHRFSGAWITVNRDCTFRCLWCYADGTEYHSSDDMTFEKAIELLHFISSLGIKHVQLIGGEPTLWPRLMPTVRAATGLGLDTILITNGYRLGSKSFLSELQSCGLGGVNLSIKAGDPSQHSKLTRTKPATFNAVLKGIHNLADSGIPFEVTAIANTCVLNDLAKICQVSTDNGAKRFSIDFCSASFDDKGNVSSEYMPKPREVVEAIISQYSAMDTATNGNFLLAQTLPTCLWPSEFLNLLESKNQVEYGCHVMSREGLVFDHIGQLLICNHLHGFSLGQFGKEFTDAISFEQFWQSSEIKGYYDQINAYPANSCINCQTYTRCGGGCPLLWFVYNPENVIGKEGIL